MCGESPRSSAVMIFDGMTRKTAPGPLRSMKMFERKRASPGMSYAKSVSCRRSNSSRFRSGMIGSSISHIDSGSNAGALSSGP